jgi:hypothetical protein
MVVFHAVKFAVLLACVNGRTVTVMGPKSQNKRSKVEIGPLCGT